MVDNEHFCQIRNRLLLWYLVPERGSKREQLAREAGGDVPTVVLTHYSSLLSLVRDILSRALIISPYLCLNAKSASCREDQRVGQMRFNVTFLLSGVINSLRSAHRLIL